MVDRIETRAQEYLSECVGADPDASRPWLVQGATVRQSTLTYHLLSETMMHGYDIAHAAGREWRIESGPQGGAVLGREFSVAELSLVTGRSAVALLPDLDGALRAELLAESPMGLSFSS